MRRIRKIFETGEWASGVDLKYTEAHPDDDSEECGWIRSLKGHVEMIINEVTDSGVKMKLKDIHGFDLYQGPYAIVNIEGKEFKIWCNDEYQLFVEDFLVDNQSEDGNRAGFLGSAPEIAEAIIMIINTLKSRKKKKVIEKLETFNG